MCGIHGFITGNTKHNNADDFVIQGYTANSLRGTDASGIASIDVLDKMFLVQKLPCPGYFFSTNDYARSLMRAANNTKTITIGHTRAATSGGTKGMSNAHPFIVRNEQGRKIVGVHNGTLNNWQAKPEAKRYTVDSEWALAHIFNNGMKAFEDFFGGYCFVWWDNENPDILNVALNNERHMSVAFSSKGGMAFASEPGMLYWLMERNKIAVDGPVLKLKPHHWYKFDITDLKNFTKEELPDNTVVTYTAATHNPAPNNDTEYYGTTAVARVDAFLKRLGKEMPPLVTDLTPTEGKARLVAPGTNSGKFVTQEEMENAKYLQMLGDTGGFQPWYDLGGEIFGEWFGSDGAQCDAVMRMASHLEYSSDTLWSVKCIGLIDEGHNKDFVVVCSRPIMNKMIDQETMH